MSESNEPVINQSPSWWLDQGRFVVESKKETKGQITLVSKERGYQLKITSHPKKGVFTLIRKIFRGGKERLRQEIDLDLANLKTAFALAPYIEESNKDFINRFRAHVGVPGKYIRQGYYLNIPAPGCGIVGDPNMSIYLSRDIRVRVAHFVGMDHPKCLQ